MILYNLKEYPSKYLKEDNIMIDIKSPLPLEVIAQKLKNNEELNPKQVIISAFRVPNYKVTTMIDNEEVSPNFPFIQNPETMSLSVPLLFEGYPFLSEENVEDASELTRDNSDFIPNIYDAYEAMQFNNNWENITFEKFDIKKEDLILQLKASLGILPTLYDVDLPIKELKRLSTLGESLFWNFLKINNDKPLNPLPTKEKIDLFDSLNAYEKKLVANGISSRAYLCHPQRILDILIEKRKFSKGIGLNIDDIDSEFSSRSIAKKNVIPFFAPVTDPDESYPLLNKEYFAKYMSLANACECSKIGREILATLELQLKQAKEKIKNIPFEVNNFELFKAYLTAEFVIPKEIFISFGEKKNSDAFLQDLENYYRDIYETEFIPKFTKNKQVEYTINDLEKFAKRQYKVPLSKNIEEAETLFKTKFKGHAPRILIELIESQTLLLGKIKLSTQELENIVNTFNQKNIQKIANRKSIPLFAFSPFFNYNSIKDEQIDLLAAMIKKKDIHSFKENGFDKWFLAHLDIKNSDLYELLEYIAKTTSSQPTKFPIKNFDVKKSAKELIYEITQKKGIAESKLMEQEYGYKFKDNELSIRGRHVEASQNGLKMYMLQKDDYRNFTVGIDTHCCQRYGNAGETCVYKYTTDPFAGCVVIEKKGKILAQGFVWTDETKDTLVFDNVEFADDRTVSQFSSIFAAWANAMPYKNIHVGVGYNQGMQGWGKKIKEDDYAILPTTLSNQRYGCYGNCYSDYHKQNARTIKQKGRTLILLKTKVNISSEKDESTKWDIFLERNEQYLLNISRLSYEEKLCFSDKFKELNPETKSPTPEIQMQAITINPKLIANIENPTEEVQLAAIKKDKNVITSIKNPVMSVLLQIIENDPKYISKVSNPSEELLLSVVKKNGLLLSRIKNPSEEVILQAIEQNGFAIRYVPTEKQTEKIKIKAIQNDPQLISFYKNPTYEMIKTAIEKDVETAMLIKSLPEDLELLVVKKNNGLINVLKNPKYESIKYAVEQNGLNIRKFQFSQPSLRIPALKQNGFAIKLLKDPLIEEYITAVETSPNVKNSFSPEINHLIDEYYRKEEELELC